MTRTRHSVCAAAVAVGLLLSTPGLGAAQPAPAAPDDIATLIAAVADANQKLQDVGAAVQSRQESVNKAIVDVQTAREQVDAAKAELAASQRAVDDANAAISAAQQRFDTFAAASYINGPSSFLRLGDEPGGRHRDRVGGRDAGDQRQTDPRRSSAGPDRASEQGIGGSGRSAESRPGGGRRSAQPG